MIKGVLTKWKNGFSIVRTRTNNSAREQNPYSLSLEVYGMNQGHWNR